MSEHHIPKKIISCYSDGELSQKEAEMVGAHLRHCLKCQKIYLDLNRMADSLHLLKSEVKPPAFLEARILARLKEFANKPQPAKTRIFSAHPHLASLVAVSLVTLGLGIGTLLGTSLSRYLLPAGQEIDLATDLLTQADETSSLAVSEIMIDFITEGDAS